METTVLSELAQLRERIESLDGKDAQAKAEQDRRAQLEKRLADLKAGVIEAHLTRDDCLEKLDLAIATWREKQSDENGELMRRARSAHSGANWRVQQLEKEIDALERGLGLKPCAESPRLANLRRQLDESRKALPMLQASFERARDDFEEINRGGRRVSSSEFAQTHSAFANAGYALKLAQDKIAQLESAVKLEETK